MDGIPVAQPRMGLTPALLDLARVIAELTAIEGRPPTLSECADEMDARRSNVHALLVGLDERGWLESRNPIELRHAPPPFEEAEVCVTAAGRGVLGRRGPRIGASERTAGSIPVDRPWHGCLYCIRILWICLKSNTARRPGLQGR